MWVVHTLSVWFLELWLDSFGMEKATEKIQSNNSADMLAQKKKIKMEEKTSFTRYVVRCVPPSIKMNTTNTLTTIVMLETLNPVIYWDRTWSPRDPKKTSWLPKTLAKSWCNVYPPMVYEKKLAMTEKWVREWILHGWPVWPSISFLLDA